MANTTDSGKRKIYSERAYKIACNRTCPACRRKSAMRRIKNQYEPGRDYKYCQYCGFGYQIGEFAKALDDHHKSPE